jgi:glycogen synthase
MSCPKNVTFLGELSRSQIFNWLKISCGYVLPVKYEPFGLSFLEAANHRTALIGGDIPTLREIWGDSMTYVDPDDHNALAADCNKLLTEKETSILNGEKAYLRSQRYTAKKMGEEYLKLYQDEFSHSEIPAGPNSQNWINN